MDVAVFTNPITGRVETMPVAMIGAYVPHASHLNLEEAARAAAIRDDEAATNLLASIEEAYTVLSPWKQMMQSHEGTSHDELSVEPPVLR